MRVLEIFSGIGAVAAAASNLPCDIVAAIDINQNASQVYSANFSTPVFVNDILTLSADRLSSFGADLWWMSPPCQPYTRRGLQRDVEDSRAQPLLHLIEMIGRIQPPHIAIENVIGFEGSESHRRLGVVLEQAGYRVTESSLCSTMFGLPNLRPRFFLLASKISQPKIQTPETLETKPISAFLDSPQQLSRWQGSLEVKADLVKQYHKAINVCDEDSTVSRCFTSAYGRSIVRSGSYFGTVGAFRRFSPSEVAALLGFPNGFQLPGDLSIQQLWKLLGNSVSVPCAVSILKAVVTLHNRVSEDRI